MLKTYRWLEKLASQFFQSFGGDSHLVLTTWMAKGGTRLVGDSCRPEAASRFRLWLLHQFLWTRTDGKVLVSSPVVEGLRRWCLTYTEDVRNCSH